MSVKPDHPEADKHRRTLLEIVDLSDQIKDLRAQRQALVEAVPCGLFTLPQGRLRVHVKRDAHICATLLARLVSRDMVNQCRVKGPYYKRASWTRLETTTPTEEACHA